MENVQFIIPQDNFGIIAQYKDNQIKECGKIDVPYESKSVFLENRLFVSLCFGSKAKSRRLKIFDENGKPLSKKDEWKFGSVNFKGNTVYLGGQFRNRKGEIFSYMDLTDPGFNIKEVELPVKAMDGKSIDDILIRNSSLFLVDNIIFPKYIFEYDIAVPNNPKYIGKNDLGNNNTYEHIIKGAINDKREKYNRLLKISDECCVILNKERWMLWNVLTLKTA